MSRHRKCSEPSVMLHDNCSEHALRLHSLTRRPARPLSREQGAGSRELGNEGAGERLWATACLPAEGCSARENARAADPIAEVATRPPAGRQA